MMLQVVCLTIDEWREIKQRVPYYHIRELEDIA